MLIFQPPIIGHRGACAYAPENTMASFTKAVQLGVKWIEFDVMLTADHEAVIFHDDTIDCTTNGKGELCRHSYATLESLDAGSWFNPRFASERIPNLKSVIDFVFMHGISANVEIKSYMGDDEKLVKKTLEVMQSALQSAPDHFLFSSFSMDALRYLRKYAPDCQLGLLLHEWEPHWQSIVRELNCVSVHVNEAILTKEAVSAIKSVDKVLLSYTVNTRERAKELFSWGVDAVFSDCPDKLG